MRKKALDSKCTELRAIKETNCLLEWLKSGMFPQGKYEASLQKFTTNGSYNSLWRYSSFTWSTSNKLLEGVMKLNAFFPCQPLLSSPAFLTVFFILSDRAMNTYINTVSPQSVTNPSTLWTSFLFPLSLSSHSSLSTIFFFSIIYFYTETKGLKRNKTHHNYVKLSLYSWIYRRLTSHPPAHSCEDFSKRCNFSSQLEGKTSKMPYFGFQEKDLWAKMHFITSDVNLSFQKQKKKFEYWRRSAVFMTIISILPSVSILPFSKMPVR